VFDMCCGCALDILGMRRAMDAFTAASGHQSAVRTLERNYKEGMDMFTTASGTKTNPVRTLERNYAETMDIFTTISGQNATLCSVTQVQVLGVGVENLYVTPPCPDRAPASWSPLQTPA